MVNPVHQFRRFCLIVVAAVVFIIMALPSSVAFMGTKLGKLAQASAVNLVLSDAEKLHEKLTDAPDVLPEKMVPSASGPTLAFTWLRDPEVSVGYKVRVGQELCENLADQKTDLPEGWTLHCSTTRDSEGRYWAQLHTPLEAADA